MRRISIGMPGAAILLPSCVAPRAAPPEQMARPQIILPELSDTCGLADLGPMIGQDFTTLAEVFIPSDLRILRPGIKVGGYISPSRLNAQLDSAGRIRDLFCG